MVTHNEKLVGSLLPFLGHRVGSWLGEETDDGEDGDRGTDASGYAPEDAGAGARGVLCAGTVRAKGDPVGCLMC